MRNALLALTLFPVLLMSASTAQTTSRTPPVDVRVTLQIHGDRSAFHIGELIPLELSFTSASPNKYQFDNASYDRSGRLNAETFAVEPRAGWDDPLAVYFSSFQGFIMGGLRGINPLSAEPTIIHLDLNEWVRFKTPGPYRVTITSSRISETGAPWSTSGVRVTSNDLTLTLISPTKEWQESTLKTALAVLDGPIQTAPFRTDQADLQMQAARTLRYLGTAGAAREMARRITGRKMGLGIQARVGGFAVKSGRPRGDEQALGGS